MPFHIVENDITEMKTDAIVNAANAMLAGGGGVCGAIFRRAGWNEMQVACDKLAPVAVGGAAVTPAFGLPQKYVIHAVGPVWQGGDRGEKQLLASAYRASLLEAEKLGLGSVSFPLISSGIFGYPKAEALSVAMDTVREFLMEKPEREMDVYLVVLDRTAVEISEKLFGEIRHYLEVNDFAEDRDEMRRRRRGMAEYMPIQEHMRRQESAFLKMVGGVAKPGAAHASVLPCGPASQNHAKDVSDAFCMEEAAPCMALPETDIDTLLSSMEPECFADRLFRFIDEKHLTDPEVYKAANLDRKLFSKIRSKGAAYQPAKSTAIALAIGAGLGYEETQELLGTAGYTLSSSSKSDVIVKFFLEHGGYDIFEIETALYKYGQPLLTAAK